MRPHRRPRRTLVDPWPLARVRRLASARAPLIAALLCGVSAGCDRPGADSRDSRTAGTVVAARATPLPDHLGLGRTPTPTELAAIDIDANAAGVGLPPGEGTYAAGAAIYAQKCAACHGAQGQGQGPYPRLVGVAPRPRFPFGNDPTIPKTIGNYWPYATTVYDYLHRAMPYNAPGSLTPHCQQHRRCGQIQR